MGRPSLLTPELADQLYEAIRAGVPYKTAAAAHGIAYETFNNWRRRGRDALAIAEEHETEVHPDDERFVQFLHGVDRARAEGLAALVVLWRQAAVHDWRAAQALAAVYQPEIFAARSRHEVHLTGTGAGEALPDERGPVMVDEVEVVPDQARAEALLGVLGEAGLLAADE